MDKASIDQEAHPYVLEANSTFDLSALQLPDPLRISGELPTGNFSALQSGSKCECPASFILSCSLQMRAYGDRQQQVSILLLFA